MASCLLFNLGNNETKKVMMDGCGDLDVYSEINGPRRTKHHPKNGKVGYLMDDGTFDYNGPGNRIFLPQHFRIQDVHESYPNATWILNWRDADSWIESGT